MLVRWLYWVLLALLMRAVWRSLLRGAVAQPPGSAGAAGAHPMSTVYKGLMVRDPICGVHVPESRALVEVRGGEKFHFCSEACRASFRSAAR
ncbi:MAG TPA: YHS domain-containing protein [Vicinamibacteria bacterium]|jgi:YHS domain-containing protein